MFLIIQILVFLTGIGPPDGELSPSNQLNAPIWSNDCMGGSGFPVTTGPFASGSWQINIEEGFTPGSFTPTLISTSRALQRSFGLDVNTLPTKADVHCFCASE